MAKPGPKPKQPHLRIANGKGNGTDSGGRKVDQNTPKPKPIAPHYPIWLTDAAKDEWKKLAPELEKLGILSSIDGPVFAVFCQAISNFRAATLEIKREGIMLTGARKRKHPALQIQRDAAGIIRQYAAEFGLTPSSRTRLSIPDQVPDDTENIFDT